MKQRWILGAGALVVIAGATMLVIKTKEPAATPAKASRSGKIDIEPGTPAAPDQVASNKPPRMVMTESGLKPMTSREPREWKDPKSGATFTEITDAVGDPKAEAKAELQYKKSRLRLEAMDAAEACWNKGPSKESIEVEYTLRVKEGVIGASDVQVKHSSITDPKVQSCILGSIKDLSSFIENVPDISEKQGLVISLDDLDKGNKKKARRDEPAPPSAKQPIDKD
ncbi:MAG: hypothetical protein WKG01_26570 [Kofleriaceae bacterium]